MTNDNRRQRLDTSSGAVAALELAATGKRLAWPLRNVTLPKDKKFRAKVWRIFDEAQAARPPGRWRDDEVIPLAMYARCIALLDRETARFQDCDPAFDPKVFSMFHQQMMSLGRKLGLTAAAGELATLGRLARNHQRMAEILAGDDDPDGLLARPAPASPH